VAQRIDHAGGERGVVGGSHGRGKAGQRPAQVLQGRLNQPRAQGRSLVGGGVPLESLQVAVGAGQQFQKQQRGGCRRDGGVHGRWVCWPLVTALHFIRTVCLQSVARDSFCSMSTSAQLPAANPPAGGGGAEPPVPLYVDLDGTLVRSDTLHESLLLLLRCSPWWLWHLLVWLWRGKAAFKQRVAEQVCPDPAHLPYTTALLDWLHAQRRAGRRLVLATAADARVAQAVAQHTGLFDAVLASNSDAQQVNLSRAHKRAAIEVHARTLGDGRYAYAGNSADDLLVWEGATEAVAVNAPVQVLRALLQRHPQARVFPAEPAGVRVWLKALRLTQWAKNALLFLPLLAAHQWQMQAWVTVALAFVAFGLCASATYLVNDLLDLPNDRRHAHKRHRPLAAGRIGVAPAVAVLGLLLPLSWVLAAAVSWPFLGMLLLYTAVTLSYSFWLKRQAVLDVLLLSALYTLRIGAGALAAGVLLSNWLLAISLFLFLGLALVKRCAELEEIRLDSAVERARGRGYHQDDLPALRAMGVASGFLTVMVLALYIDSQNGRELYAQPAWLWGAAPLLLWWLMRIWLKTGRRELKGEDPLQFALHDRFSWAVLAGMGVLGVLASWGA